MDAEGSLGLDPKAGMVSALSGQLPCLRCKYNLRGLSVLGVCPECGTPVRATLLSVVDPLARELRPIRRRRIVAWGLVLWIAAAIAAAACVWFARGADAVEVLINRPLRVEWAGRAASVLILLSGLGAGVLIRPHRGIPWRQSFWAGVGVVHYLPLSYTAWKLLVELDASAITPYLGAHEELLPQRAVLRLVFAGWLIVILLALRPNARVLASRSLLMREGRVDRQTMLAMVAVVVVGAAGDVLHLFAADSEALWSGIAGVGGTLLIAVSSLLLTVGLVGILMDVWRIRGVILDPPPTLIELIERPEPLPPDARAVAGDTG